MNPFRNDFINEATLLVVDDTPQNIDILADALGDNYSLIVATNGREALEAVDDELPDLILLDIIMPEMDGYETCRYLKESKRTREIPIIFLSALTDIDEKTKGFQLGAVDYITKPFNVREVLVRVETHLAVKIARDVLENQKDILEELVLERTKEIVKTQDITIRMAASLAETRDNETGNHIIRTQRYVKEIALALMREKGSSRFLNPRQVELLVKSAPLHDIGKIGVPDAILLKPGKLDDEEFTEMKRHTIYGKDALMKTVEKMSDESFLLYAQEIAYSHHEKWDGTGYPQGLKGREIPLSGRIMAVADVYDALISKRVYKKPFTHTKAVSIIAEGRGRHFDPLVVDSFLNIQEVCRKIALGLMEFDEEREAVLQ